MGKAESTFVSISRLEAGRVRTVTADSHLGYFPQLRFLGGPPYVDLAALDVWVHHTGWLSLPPGTFHCDARVRRPRVRFSGKRREMSTSERPTFQVRIIARFVVFGVLWLRCRRSGVVETIRY